MNDPQQELFSVLKLALEARGFDVYDGALPPEYTPYPFVYLGDFQQTDIEYKNAVTGFVYPTIHVWHNNTRQRGTLSKMLLEVKTEFRKLIRTQSYSWAVRNITTQIAPDNTTKTPLLHGVVNADFMFS